MKTTVMCSLSEAKGKAEASRIRRSQHQSRPHSPMPVAGRKNRAEGEARAAKYLEQMQEEPELATFLVWLDALQRSLSKYHLILPWNAAWHLMRPGTAAQTAAGDIPQPVAVGP